MKHIAILVILVGGGLFAAEHYNGEAKPVIGDVSLADGRVLHQVRILSAAQTSLNVACDRGIVTVDRKLLPAEISAANPYVPPAPIRIPQRPAPADVRFKDGRAFKAARPLDVVYPGDRFQFYYDGGGPDGAVAPLATAPDEWLDYLNYRLEKYHEGEAQVRKQMRENARRMAAEEARTNDGIHLMSLSADPAGGFILELKNPSRTIGPVQIITPSGMRLATANDDLRLKLRLDQLVFRTRTGETLTAKSDYFDADEIRDLGFRGLETRRFHLHFPAKTMVIAVGWYGNPASWLSANGTPTTATNASLSANADPGLALMNKQLAEHAAEQAKEQERRDTQERIRQQRLARSPDGLFIVGASGDADGGVTVLLKNVTDNPQIFHFHGLRGRVKQTGAIVDAGDVRFAIEDRVSYEVDPGQQRPFRVIFAGGHRIAAISWSERPDDWTVVQ